MICFDLGENWPGKSIATAEEALRGELYSSAMAKLSCWCGRAWREVGAHWLWFSNGIINKLVEG